MKSLKKFSLATLAASVLCVAPVISHAHGETEIRFLGQVNGQPFECGKSYSNVGTTNSTIMPSDFRMFISDVKLIDANGKTVPLELTQDKTWQFENVALIDFESGASHCRNGTGPLNQSVRGTVPHGQYKGIEFTLGVPFELNHGNPTVAPAPLSSTAMFWNWQGGYKFLKFDAATTGRPSPTQPADPQGGGNASGFSVHLGSTACASDSKTTPPSSCKNPNRVTVRFDSFDPSKDIVIADIGAVLANANVDVNTPKTAAGCMSFPNDPDCPPIMKAFGLPYDGQPGGVQQFFRKQ